VNAAALHPTSAGTVIELMRWGPAGAERPAVRDSAGRVYDLSSLTEDIDGSFLSHDGISRVWSALEAGNLTPMDTTGLRLGAPVARPGALICIGQNYAAHAAESGAPPPDQPIIFLKHPNTIVGPFDEIRIPPGADKVDREVELAVVIQRQARYLSSEREAAECIAGYTVSNDVSERNFQLRDSGGQWSKGKCCETFNPLGPSLVPADCIDDVQALRLRSWVNGEPRQDSSTADMIFGVLSLVVHLSQYLVLEPGDIVNTGTPEGVALSGRFGYLRPGDRYEAQIDQLGRQGQLVTSHASAHTTDQAMEGQD